MSIANQYPLAFGRVTGPLTWFVANDDPALELAEGRIHVTCPHCGETNVHGWPLDGAFGTNRYGEASKTAHCGCPPYLVRPDDGAAHVYDPTLRLTRPARRRSEGRTA